MTDLQTVMNWHRAAARESYRYWGTLTICNADLSPNLVAQSAWRNYKIARAQYLTHRRVLELRAAEVAA